MTRCYSTKHRVKVARAKGEIPKAEGRDVGRSFYPVHYSKRGKDKNKQGLYERKVTEK